MKTTNFIFKIAALVLAGAAIVCCVLANLDRITDSLLTLKEQVASRRGRPCPCDVDAEEYEDWDI